jgi:Tn3 transposase DDE domain
MCKQCFGPKPCQYLADAELRSTIQSATNKSEAFNGFAKWAFFGGEGVITHNRRAEQRKCIKFIHLIANCLIFYNVQVISDVLHQLNQEGIELDEQVVAASGSNPCHTPIRHKPLASSYEVSHRKLHFGDVVARVHMLRTLEMHLARRASEFVPIVFHPSVQGHIGPTKREIISRVNRAGHQSAWQCSDTDQLVACQSSWQWHCYFHIYRHAFIMQLMSGMQQKQMMRVKRKSYVFHLPFS